MSNPCINRWGLNSFWRHYWYSDSRYALNLKQDKLFTDLLQTYLAYGVEAPSNTLLSSYWFKTTPKLPLRNFSARYRWYETYDSSTDTWDRTQLRLMGGEIFQTRISILRFGAWLVINLYWFQPDKRGKRRSSRIRRSVFTDAVQSHRHTMSKFIKSRTLTLKVLPKSTLTPSKYEF